MVPQGFPVIERDYVTDYAFSSKTISSELHILYNGFSIGNVK